MNAFVRAARAVIVAGAIAVPVAAQQAPPPAQQTPTPTPQGQAPAGRQTPPVPGAQTPAAPATPGAAATTPPAPIVPLPPGTPPGTTGSITPGVFTCPVPVAPATAPARAFTTTTGVILTAVIPTKVMDFERFLSYLKDALAKTSNPTLREQAKGWTILRDTGVGPNGDVVYTFLFNPAVPCVDYSLGPIIAEAFPDPAQLKEVWTLFTSSQRQQSLMNLAPVTLQPPQPLVTPPTTPVTPATGTQKPGATPAPAGRGGAQRPRNQ